ncbi:hypothetical protein G6F32_017120 [Rhizopus arrhizus]|nr:hypothetical protein G6F32_017120 [Rhizopus arrhizus]
MPLHDPCWPLTALVVITAPAATVTFAADVSTNPPLPPLGALASSLPATAMRSLTMSPSNTILPFSPVASVLACVMPVWLMTVLAKSPAALAVR